MIFDVVVNGYNLLARDEKNPEFIQRQGFFIRRIIEATNQDEAIEKVLANIQRDPRILSRMMNPPDNMPDLEIESVTELSDDEVKKLNVEAINYVTMFFPEEEG